MFYMYSKAVTSGLVPSFASVLLGALMRFSLFMQISVLIAAN